MDLWWIKKISQLSFDKHQGAILLLPRLFSEMQSHFLSLSLPHFLEIIPLMSCLKISQPFFSKVFIQVANLVVNFFRQHGGNAEIRENKRDCHFFRQRIPNCIKKNNPRRGFEHFHYLIYTQDCKLQSVAIRQNTRTVSINSQSTRAKISQKHQTPVMSSLRPVQPELEDVAWDLRQPSGWFLGPFLPIKGEHLRWGGGVAPQGAANGTSTAHTPTHSKPSWPELLLLLIVSQFFSESTSNHKKMNWESTTQRTTNGIIK